MSFRDAIDQFLESQRIDRGSAAKTIEAYRTDLTQFARWLPDAADLEKIDRALVEEFLASLSREGNRPSSIARKASALRQFFKFCLLEKKLSENPAERLESPSLPKKLPKHIGQETATALLHFVDNEGIRYSIKDPELLAALHARDRAMVYLLYATGLRVSELVSLTLRNIDIQQGYLRVRGKGGKERIVPFANVAGERVHEYMTKHRHRLVGKDPSDCLFLNRGGTALTRQSFWKNLKTLASLAGVSDHLSPHMLRHSFAVHLMTSGMNLRSLQTLLGHSDLATTQIYTNVTPGHLKAQHRKFHPRGGG